MNTEQIIRNIQEDLRLRVEHLEGLDLDTYLEVPGHKDTGSWMYFICYHYFGIYSNRVAAGMDHATDNARWMSLQKQTVNKLKDFAYKNNEKIGLLAPYHGAFSYESTNHRNNYQYALTYNKAKLNHVTLYLESL